MATVTLSSSNATLSHIFFTLDDTPPGRSREASFSSYLSAGDDGSFSVRLSGEVTDQVRLGGGRKKAVATGRDDELDVFGAEKYFSGGMDAAAVEVGFEQEKPWRASRYKEADFPGVQEDRTRTPSEFSEASGDSRSLLLRDARRDKSSRSYSDRTPASGGKRFLGIFRCFCTDKSSVDVGKVSKEGGGGGGNPASRPPGTSKQVLPEFWCGEEVGRHEAASGGAFGPRREDFFSFPPALSPVVVLGNSTVGAAKVFEEERKARIPAMDVFGTATFLGKEEVSTGLRRSMTIISPFRAAAKIDDDACSEASSDLFEIESLSTSTFPAAGGGTSAFTTCYEPSEASIEWSVVTASAANCSVVGSDGGESPPNKGRKSDGEQQHRHQQRAGGGGGLLTGCGSAKAVNVASNGAAHRVPPAKVEAGERRWRYRSMDALVSETRCHAECLRSVDYEHGSRATPAGHVLAARGIPRPITAAHVPRPPLPH